MNDKPDTHDFDWVTARDKCAVQKEFRQLMNFIEENCKTRRRCMPDNHPYVYDFCEKDSYNFRVEKTATLFGKHVVEFCLKNDGILVGGSDTDPPWRMKLTLRNL